MSKVSHLPKNVPPKDLPLKVKIKGSTTKHPYEGDFIIEVPNTRQMSRIGIECAKLNDGVAPEALDRSTLNLNNAIAWLRVCVKQGPAWFVNDATDPDEEGMEYGLETMDVNIPIHIFRESQKLITDWYEALKGQPSESAKS